MPTLDCSLTSLSGPWCRLTDADLLDGARGGDAEAWRAMYQRHLPAVWRQAYALVSDMHAAEDISSEVMLALLRGLDNLEMDGSRIGGWLRAVVRHKAADYQRKVFQARDKLGAAAVSETDCTAAANPSAPLEDAEMRSQVLKTLDALPERQRLVLEWKYLDALAVREIAARLQETEKAVESILYRARREFRRIFELQEDEQGRACDRKLQGDTDRES